jgi:integrase
MYKKVKGTYYYSHVKNGVEYSDPFIASYSKYLVKREFSIGTIEKNVTKIHKFWLYAMYFPSKNGQSFYDYITDYRDALQKGILIKERSYNETIGIEFERIVAELKKVKDPTQDMSALKSYYKFIVSPVHNPHYNDNTVQMTDMYFDMKNKSSTHVREKYSHGAGYGLKSRGIMREVLLEKESVFSELGRSKKYKESNDGIPLAKNKVFPSYAFDYLLKISKPRERLLYLLCGAAGARRSQALSLTVFDVDQKNNFVYLVDPHTDSVPFDQNGKIYLEQKPRKQMLLQDYGINPEATPHNLIRFKHPIPSLDDFERNLYFLNEKYAYMFQETYREVFRTLNRKNPFVFQTNTGKRWLPSGANKAFKADLKKLRIQYPHLKIPELSNSIHSLRHMFGSYMANIAYFIQSKSQNLGLVSLPDGRTTNILELWKNFTRKKMGHAFISSTEVYFSAERYIEDFAIEMVKENMKEYTAINNRLIVSLNHKYEKEKYERKTS